MEKGACIPYWNETPQIRGPSLLVLWGCPQGRQTVGSEGTVPKTVLTSDTRCKVVGRQFTKPCFDNSLELSRSNWKLLCPQLCYITGEGYRLDLATGREHRTEWGKVPGQRFWPPWHQCVTDAWNITYQGSLPEPRCSGDFGGLITLTWLNDWLSRGWSQPPAKGHRLIHMVGLSGMAGSHPKTVRCG